MNSKVELKVFRLLIIKGSREKMAQRTNSIQWRVILPSAILFYKNIFLVKPPIPIHFCLFIFKKKKTNNRKYDVKCCNDTKPICLFTIFGWFIKKQWKPNFSSLDAFFYL